MITNAYSRDFFKLFVFNLFLTIAISVGLIDRSFSFLLLALLAAFIITKPLKESLLLFLVSLPVFIALPLGIALDNISIWRPLSVLLALRWLWEHRDILWHHPLIFWQEIAERRDLLRLIIALGLFTLIATISLFWASDIALGIKTIIYFVNVFGIIFLYAWEVKRQDLLLFLQRSLIPAGIAVIVGFLQFGLTFTISLFTFWQWWAQNPILAYYGSKTSRLLSYSNTWFSYYGKDIPPTLRMFSFFQDSHSFAMFMIISAGLWGVFFLLFTYCEPSEQKGSDWKGGSYWRSQKGSDPRSGSYSERSEEKGSDPRSGSYQHDKKGMWLSGGSVVISLLAIILSGSRGAWLGAALLLLSLLIIRFSPPTQLSSITPLVKKALIGVIVFFILFPASSILLAAQQKAQLIMEGRAGEIDLRLAFLRARSTFDIDELSNKGRLEIWSDSYRFLRDHKFLRGTGIGNFPTVLALLPEKSRLGASAHSLYLQIFVELGLVGLLSFLAILFLIIRQGLKILQLPITNYQLPHYFAFCFLCSFVWIAFYSLVDVILLNDKVFLLVAILVGMLYSLERKTAARG